MAENDEMERIYKGIESIGSKFDVFAQSTIERLAKIETRFDMFEKSTSALSAKFDTLEKTANESLASTKSAHKRIDGVEQKSIEHAEIEAIEERLDKLDKIVFWITTTVIGAVILAVIGAVLINK